MVFLIGSPGNEGSVLCETIVVILFICDHPIVLRVVGFVAVYAAVVSPHTSSHSNTGLNSSTLDMVMFHVVVPSAGCVEPALPLRGTHVPRQPPDSGANDIYT
jgi:hypothetical protein